MAKNAVTALSKVGLPISLIDRHHRLLFSGTNSNPTFRVVDSCRFDNGGVLPQRWIDTSATACLPSSCPASSGIVAFVPAAGAASRYIRAFTPLHNALCGRGDGEEAVTAVKMLVECQVPLPDAITTLVQARSVQHISGDLREAALAATQLPKALMPCVSEGARFFDLKRVEHRAMAQVEGEAYVVGIDTDAADFGSGVRIYRQDQSLSTVRFFPDGRLFLSEQGRPAIAPAGHGALAELFPQVSQDFSRAHTAFIRNIDNVMGLQPEALKACQLFLDQYLEVKRWIESIRTAMRAEDLGAAHSAIASLEHVTLKLPPNGQVTSPATFSAVRDPYEQKLWQIQANLFHSPIPDICNRRALFDLYQRPLNILGQVPNSGKDVGGTPCFVDHQGKVVKLCLEVPHASPQDRETYFENPLRATHFNPGFVAAELTGEAGYYSAKNESFWLRAEKEFQGQTLVHFETVLYELLGNSTLANTLFVEVPRCVFNPHKSVEEAAGRTLASWQVSPDDFGHDW